MTGPHEDDEEPGDERDEEGVGVVGVSAPARGALGALHGSHEDLLAEVVALRAEKAERVRADGLAYLESVAKRSADAQAPLDFVKLEKIRAHVEAGRLAEARELGEAMLEAAQAKGAKPFTRVAAGPKQDEHEAGAARGLARLRARGRAQRKGTS